MQIPIKKHRFEALDSLRGICACLIAVMHLSSAVPSHFSDLPILDGAYLFVDFFFVLSGFVIANSYQTRLTTGLPFGEFVILRLGRIYPLHLFTLILFVLFECSKFFVHTKSVPFGSEGNNPLTLLENLLLLQGLGTNSLLSWNFPSWSISVEFFTYIIYALVLIKLRKKAWAIATLLVIAAPAVFVMYGKTSMDITFDLGLLRCLYGFSIGCFAFHFFQRIQNFNSISRLSFTYIEILSIWSVVYLSSVFFANDVSFFSPYLFGFAVIVFAFQSGNISTVLKARPMLFLGAISYSIYMTHAFVQLVFTNVVKILDRVANTGLVETKIIEGEELEILSVSTLTGDIIHLAVLSAMILLSYFTYRFIEKPCNDWARRYVVKKRAENLIQESALEKS